MGRLQDRRAIVTGSDSGIGQAIAIAFAREGADCVVTWFSDEDGAGHTRQQIEAAGRRALVVRLDVRDERSVHDMFDAAVGEFGGVDILVNDAGVDASGTNVAELSTETWDDAMRTNLYGYFFCARRFAQLRREAGGAGKLIQVTSLHDRFPRAGAADYDCSKAGERMLTRTLALELAPLGVNVNSIAPGMVLTPFNQKAIDDPKVREQQVQSIPFKRAARPEEIASVAVFLASSEADYVTGAEWDVDGGLAMQQAQGA